MTDGLLVGVLVKTGERPMVVVVDKRVSKKQDALPARDVEVTFASAVGRVEVLTAGASQWVDGSMIRLGLKAGDGALVRLVPVPGQRAALQALTRPADGA
jgi:hypothetical protein